MNIEKLLTFPFVNWLLICLPYKTIVKLTIKLTFLIIVMSSIVL